MRFIYSKIFLWFVAVLVLVGVVIMLQSRGWFGPLQKFILYLPRPIIQASRNVANPVANFFSNIYSIRSIIKENNTLHVRVSELQEEVAALHFVRSENEALKSELGFVSRAPFILEPCTVLAQDPEGVTNTAVLNCGSAKGIRSGQAVVVGGYLVGKVFIVNPSTSTVRLITHPDLSLDAKISANNVAGLVKGSFGSGAVMDLISQTATVKTGDLVVSAGINELVPKDVLIGAVAEVVSGENDLFKKVTLTSPVHFNDLRYVFVIK